MSAQIFSFAEARAQKLRKEDSHLGRVFRNLEEGPMAKEIAELSDVKDEVLIRWAYLLSKGDHKTIQTVVEEVETMLAEVRARV